MLASGEAVVVAPPNRRDTAAAVGHEIDFKYQYFAKGRPIMIEGRLKLDTWQDKKTNENRSKLKVVIENFYFVDSKPGGSGGDRGR